jgi:hypothetical protein
MGWREKENERECGLEIPPQHKDALHSFMRSVRNLPREEKDAFFKKIEKVQAYQSKMVDRLKENRDVGEVDSSQIDEAYSKVMSNKDALSNIGVFVTYAHIVAFEMQMNPSTYYAFSKRMSKYLSNF